MMQKSHFLAVCILYLLFTSAFAGSLEVPQTMEFAGMNLKIHESARKLIQKDVAALQSNQKYFQMKLERVDMYFPVIEKILAEEGLPDDFKYLAVQESSLVSDAVSTSNAVGYWQFKKESALEVGLLVNSQVDERKHIVSATYGAARYLKRNNIYLQNWVYTLLSYNLGLGGCRNIIKEREVGAEKMDIDGKTHWYIIKFLAHKIAFQDAIGKNTARNLTLLQYTDCRGKKLSDIAEEMEVDAESLQLYNKWLTRNRIPEDRDYIVIVPAPANQLALLMAKMNISGEQPRHVVVNESEPVATAQPLPKPDFPQLKKKRSKNQKGSILYTINGKPGIQAQEGDNIARLTEKADISREKFIKYNDLKPNQALVPGQVYYLKKKGNKAKADEHVVIEGETLWQVAHMYGITINSLLRKNRMKKPERLQHGRVLWLRSIRPSNIPVEIKNIPKPVEKNIAQPLAKPEVKDKPEIKPETKNNTALAAKKKKPATAPVKKETATAPALPPMFPETSPVEIVKPQRSASSNTTQKQVSEKPAPQVNTVIETKTEEAAPEAETAPETAEEPDATSKTHRVTSGQSLYSISKLYGVTIDQLKEWNNLQASGLKVGQNLIISQPDADTQNTPEESSSQTAPDEPAEEEYTEYTVRRGDSLYKIAKNYSVTVRQLQEWNQKTDAGVSVGEKLKIKRK